LRRLAFFKSAAAPAASETESIMRTESPLENRQQDKVVFVVHEVIRHAISNKQAALKRMRLVKFKLWP
jgi:hypothetical protein